jgi:molybdopterin synthase sulfur carrier subunit
MATNHQPSITVVYFAAAHTCTGLHSEDILLPVLPKEAGFPLSKLGSLLLARHGQTGLEGVLETSRWSVNLEMITDVNAVILKGGEEVTATFAWTHSSNTGSYRLPTDCQIFR